MTIKLDYNLHNQKTNDMIYDEETDRCYLNDFHKKNSEAVMEYLRKQKPLSVRQRDS